MLSLQEPSSTLYAAPDLPSIENFISILQKCRRTRNLHDAKHVHSLVCNNGLETHSAIGNQIVPMFVECKGIPLAEQVFEKLVHVNEFSWTSVLSAKSETGALWYALTLYSKMQEEDVSPSSHTLVALLKACARERDLNKAREIHFEAVEMGFERDLYFGSALIDAYCKCGTLVDAQDVLNDMPERGVVSWTTLMAGYVDYGPCHEALKCFDQMQMDDGIAADAFSFACSLKACGLVGCLDKGREIHMELTNAGYEQDLFVGSSLVAMYGKCGSSCEAQNVFDSIPVQDIVLWNTLLTGFSEHGLAQEAVMCFERMQAKGIRPDAVTFAGILKCCGDIDAVEKGQEICTLIKQQKLECHHNIANNLISFYAKHGLHTEAQEVLNKLADRDVVSWTALIAGYIEQGFNMEALQSFKQMQEDGIPPDAYSLACTLKACSNVGATDMCHQLHMEVLKAGFERDLFVVTALVNAYATCVHVVDAFELFDKLPERDAALWNSLFAGFVEGGVEEEVFEFLELMQSEGVAMDAVTYACTLKACSNLGAMNKGQKINMEVTCKGLDNDPSIGGSLISMYARCGSLLDARDVFDKLPVRGPIAWSLMIKGYSLNHEGGMVIECFGEMQKEGVKPDAVIFTCLLTACSHGSLVSEGQKYFSRMREEFGVEPTKEHYTCMVDLLARSGHLYEAEKFLDIMTHVSEVTWAAILCACKTHLEADLGWRCLQQLIQKSPGDGTWYVIMADIFASTGRVNDVFKLEELRKHVGAKKKPASAFIEVNDKMHEFVVHNVQSKEISDVLRSLTLRAKGEGYLPNLELDLKPHPDEMKDVALCEHAEKLAIAFGLLNTPQGATLRVTKNLRMCNDCHGASKIIAKLERREIIVRDDCCVHHFKEGLCSCGDMF